MKHLISSVVCLVFCMFLSTSLYCMTEKHIGDLDLPLQSRISAELGKDNPAFHIRKEGTTYKASSQGITASVDRNGLMLEQGGETWSVTLVAIGREPFTPRTILHLEQNRIERKDRIATEWYVNGPLGLEQGWTIRKRPQGATPIMLSFRTGGTLRQAITKDRITLTDTQGTTRFTYGGLAAFDADARPLPVHFENRDHGFLLVVDDTKARYPVVIDPYVQQTATLTASNTKTYQGNGVGLGGSVAVSADGSTIATPGWDTDYWQSGAIYVFSKGAGWVNGTEVAKLNASDKASFSSVAVSADGSTIAAGSPYSSPGGIAQAGAVYVFSKGTGWVSGGTQVATFIASDNYWRAYAWLGYSIAISADGSTIAAGSPNTMPLGATDASAVYVFSKGTGWANGTESAKLTASDKSSTSYDNLGSSVAISTDGSTVAAGAPHASPGGAEDAGAVYVFSKGTGPGPMGPRAPSLRRQTIVWGILSWALPLP